jgi:hypothetical protein
MKTTFRTIGPDVLQKPPKAKPQDRPGAVQHGRLAIIDGKGRHRGTVGPRATSATVARFIGQHGAKLGRGPNGKHAWIGPKADRNVIGGHGSPQAAKLDKQLRTDRGSVKS